MLETPCSNEPCRNGGICTDVTEQAYVCECQHGYLGIDCNHTNLFLFDNPCLNNSTCHIQSNDNNLLECLCPINYFGIYCEICKFFLL